MPEPRHLSPETLLAYHERTLSDAEVERVQDHLVECPECASVVLDLESFPDLEPPTEAHRLTPADLRRQWADIEHRISERRPWWQRHQVLLPVAAAFFAAAVALGFWAQNAQSELRAADQPSGDVHVIELAPPSAAHRGLLRETAPSDVETLVIVLDPGLVDAFPSYSVDVESPDGVPIAQRVPVHQSQHRLFVLMVSRESLPPGVNTLELFGERGGERIPIEEFELTADR
jgi:hypothetical protein